MTELHSLLTFCEFGVTEWVNITQDITVLLEKKCHVPDTQPGMIMRFQTSNSHNSSYRKPLELILHHDRATWSVNVLRSRCYWMDKHNSRYNDVSRKKVACSGKVTKKISKIEFRQSENPIHRSPRAAKMLYSIILTTGLPGFARFDIQCSKPSNQGRKLGSGF